MECSQKHKSARYLTSKSVECAYSVLCICVCVVGASEGSPLARDPSLYPSSARAFPNLTFMKPDWLDNVVREYTAAKEAVCLIDLSFFSKISVTVRYRYRYHSNHLHTLL